jgi:hypothetical protein
LLPELRTHAGQFFVCGHILDFELFGVQDAKDDNTVVLETAGLFARSQNELNGDFFRLSSLGFARSLVSPRHILLNTPQHRL